MALKFYWRCESSTFTGDDYSSGDTTPNLTSITFGAEAAKVGTNGLIGAASANANATFDPTGILPSGGAIDSTVFACGYWWKSETSFSGSGIVNGLRIYSSAVGNGIAVETRAGNLLRLELNNPVPESLTTCQIATALSADTSYFVVCRVDVPGDKSALEVYADAGDSTLALVDSVEVLSGVSGVINSTDLGASEWTALQFAVKSSTQAYRTFTDNIILSDSYDAPIQDNAFITTDGDYVETPVVTYVKVLAHADFASETGIEGVVLNATRDTVIGEFSGQTAEATLEGGEAVLLIAAADITPDGNLLTTTDTPIVFAYNATESLVGPASATVIEV